MKRTLLFTIFTLVFFANLYAQNDLPNVSFEEWQVLDGGKEMPTNWISRDAHDPNSTHIYCKKEENAEEGNFSFSLHNKHQGNACYASYIDLGEIDPTDSNDPIKEGMAIAGKPTALGFYYQYYNSDINPFYTGYVQVELKKWDEILEEEIVVGEGALDISENVSEFTYTEVPITYSSDEEPDKIYIRFGNPCTPADSVTLQVDFVGLKGMNASVSNNDLTSLSAVKAMPNPASDYFQISGVEGTAEVELINILGSVKQSYTIRQNEKINTAQLSNGLYFYRLKQKGKIKYTGRVKIQH